MRRQGMSVFIAQKLHAKIGNWGEMGKGENGYILAQNTQNQFNVLNISTSEQHQSTHSHTAKHST